MNKISTGIKASKQCLMYTHSDISLCLLPIFSTDNIGVITDSKDVASKKLSERDEGSQSVKVNAIFQGDLYATPVFFARDPLVF